MTHAIRPKGHSFWHACALLSALLSALLVSCSPSMNWREVRFEGDEFMALMPCKPEEATRQVTLLLEESTQESPSASAHPTQPLKGQASTQTSAQPLQMQLSLKACKAQGMQFTFAKLSAVETAEPNRAIQNSTQTPAETHTKAVRSAWQQASIASFLQARGESTVAPEPTTKTEPLVPRAAFNGQLIDAQNASGMRAQWLWRESSGGWYQAGVYASQAKEFNVQDAQTYFESLR